jgi:hypothetical protein
MAFLPLKFQLVREIQFPHEQEKTMEKQAPIVFWDFETEM